MRTGLNFRICVATRLRHHPLIVRRIIGWRFRIKKAIHIRLTVGFRTTLPCSGHGTTGNRAVARIREKSPLIFVDFKHVAVSDIRLYWSLELLLLCSGSLRSMTFSNFTFLHTDFKGLAFMGSGWRHRFRHLC